MKWLKNSKSIAIIFWFVVSILMQGYLILKGLTILEALIYNITLYLLSSIYHILIEVEE